MSRCSRPQSGWASRYAPSSGATSCGCHGTPQRARHCSKRPLRRTRRAARSSCTRTAATSTTTSFLRRRRWPTTRREISASSAKISRGSARSHQPALRCGTRANCCTSRCSVRTTRAPWRSAPPGLAVQTRTARPSRPGQWSTTARPSAATSRRASRRMRATGPQPLRTTCWASRWRSCARAHTPR